MPELPTEHIKTLEIIVYRFLETEWLNVSTVSTDDKPRNERKNSEVYSKYTEPTGKITTN